MEQQNNFSHSQLLLYSSIGATILLLVVVLLTFDKKEPSSYKSIKLATGEWAPYTGQNLPEYGKTSAIVTHVLRNMGYQPEFQFMPWSNAESRSIGKIKRHFS
jgi:polar amino acid transport system substrate-binding protein